MKKFIYFIPAIILFLFYIVIGFLDSFSAINPIVWIWIILLFLAGFIMIKSKWYGCILGIIIGFILIYMSTLDTGQIINIELPTGIILCIYYSICGYIIYKNNK